MKRFLCVLLLGACGGVVEDPPPLSCKVDTVIDTDDGRRLVVKCTREVEKPPIECEHKGEAVYYCTTLHTYQEWCDTFVGACDA